MIPRGPVTRFAASDSPEREARLLGHDPATPRMSTDTGGFGHEENEQYAPDSTISEHMRSVRTGVSELDLLHALDALPADASRERKLAFIERYGDALRAWAPEMARYSREMLLDPQSNAIDMLVNDLRARLPDVLGEGMHGKDHPNAYYNIGENGNDYKAAYLKAMILGRAKNTNIEELKRMTLDELKERARQHDIDPNDYPNAFQYENNIYFNASDERYKDSDYRERIVAHELTHYVLDRRPEHLLLTIKSKLQAQNGAYDRVMQALTVAIGPEIASMSESQKMHEVLAIYFGGTRVSYDVTDEQTGAYQTITSEMADAREHSSTLDELLKSINEDIVRDEGFINQHFETAVIEETSKQDYMKNKHAEVHANPDKVAKDLAKKDLEEEEANELARLGGEQNLNAVKIKGQIDELLEKVGHFRNELPKLFERTGGTEQDRAAMNAICEEIGGEGTRLLSMKNEADRIQADESLDEDAKKKAFLAILKAMATIRAPIERINEFHREVEQRLTQEADRKADVLAGDDEKDSKEPTTILGWMRKQFSNVRFLSVYDMIKLFNVYKEAILDSYHSQQNVRVYKTAKDLANYLDYVPFGKPIQQILFKQARAANDEETSKFADYIKSEGFTYDELLGGSNSILSQNIHNVNRGKAIIEYAADHGWLYKMDKKDGHDVYGLDFEGEFGTHSFLELINRNEAGKEKEEKRGAERVKYHPDIALIIEDMHDELKKKNIFAIRGMLKVLQDKAKVGHSNTWGMITLLRHMRRDKELLQIMDKGLLDSIGSIGIAQAAWSLTLLKLERHNLTDWKNGEKSLSDSILGSTVEKIENKLWPLKQKVAGTAPGTDEREKAEAELDEAVAKVLAGKTYRDNGVVVSIFERDFNEYRKYWISHATTIDPGKTDDDFFNPANDSADVLLLSGDSIGLILSRQSQGPYVHEVKSRGFLAMVIKREIELRDQPDAHANYVKEMRAKLEIALRKNIEQPAALTQITKEITPTYKKDKDVPHMEEVSKINIFDTLRNNGLLSEEFYKYALLKTPANADTAQQKEITKKATEQDTAKKKQQALDKLKKTIEKLAQIGETSEEALNKARSEEKKLIALKDTLSAEELNARAQKVIEQALAA